MENKISIIALVTVFYIFGLSAFYTGLHAGFACFVCILLIVLCLLNKINPKICVVLNLVFIFGFYNANFHNKESDSFSFINAANNVNTAMFFIYAEKASNIPIAPLFLKKC